MFWFMIFCVCFLRKYFHVFMKASHEMETFAAFCPPPPPHTVTAIQSTWRPNVNRPFHVLGTVVTLLWNMKCQCNLYVFVDIACQFWMSTLQWRHNGRNSVSNHQPHYCLLNRLFRRRSKKTLKLRVTGLCAGNSPGTGDFPAQMVSNAENVSIWWRHHGSWTTWFPAISHRSGNRLCSGVKSGHNNMDLIAGGSN